MKKPQLKIKNIRAIEINCVPTNIFRRILTSLRKKPDLETTEEGDNYGGWFQPLGANDMSEEKDAEGYVVLLPPLLEFSETRKLISTSLGIILEDYDVIVVHDAR
jgi:hypothetical protein